MVKVVLLSRAFCLYLSWKENSFTTNQNCSKKKKKKKRYNVKFCKLAT